MYVINHFLDLFFKSALMPDLKNSHIHTYSFDKSLNEVAQTCEMELYLGYSDVKESLVRTRYYQSSFLGHVTLSHGSFESF